MLAKSSTIMAMKWSLAVTLIISGIMFPLYLVQHILETWLILLTRFARLTTTGVSTPFAPLTALQIRIRLYCWFNYVWHGYPGIEDIVQTQYPTSIYLNWKPMHHQRGNQYSLGNGRTIWMCVGVCMWQTSSSSTSKPARVKGCSRMLMLICPKPNVRNRGWVNWSQGPNNWELIGKVPIVSTDNRTSSWDLGNLTRY